MGHAGAWGRVDSRYADPDRGHRAVCLSRPGWLAGLRARQGWKPHSRHRKGQRSAEAADEPASPTGPRDDGREAEKVEEEQGRTRARRERGGKTRGKTTQGQADRK